VPWTQVVVVRKGRHKVLAEVLPKLEFMGQVSNGLEVLARLEFILARL
jgi:hypothetical protein